MIEIHRSALVLVSADKFYQLVNDIEAYPQFLDGVSSTEIIEQTDTEMVGRLIVKKAGIERALITRNQLQYPTRIEMNLEEGPLDYLKGVWSFKPLQENGCRVSLDLAFSASKGLKMLAFNAIFKQVADGMVDAFVDRAHAIYS